MASIYKKHNSPFWFIQFLDADGVRRNRSTSLRTDNPAETVKARTLRAQLEAKELNRNAGEIRGGGWDTWGNTSNGTAKALERYNATLAPGRGLPIGCKRNAIIPPRNHLS